KSGLGSTFYVILGIIVAVLAGGGMYLVKGFRDTPTPGAEVTTDPTRPAVNLPPELEAKVHQELTPDEQIIWGGQPSPRVTRLKGLAAAGGMLFMALIAGVILLGYLGTVKGGGTIIIPGVAGLFVVIGLAGMFLAPIMKHKLAQRTWYVVTNRR